MFKERKDKEINKNELNDVISLSKKILNITYILIIVFLVLAGIIVIQKVNVLNIVLDFISVISPFFIGFIIAWLLRPLVKKLNKKINNNTLSSMIVFGIFVLVLIITLYIFLPTLYNEVNELVGLLPSFVEKLTNNINNLFNKFANSSIDLSEFKNKILSNISSLSIDFAKDLPNTIINLITSLFSGIGTFAMGLIIGIYMLIDYESISKHFRTLIPDKYKSDAHELLKKISGEVRKCVNGTFLVALMVFVCDSIGFALVGLNAPMLFGLLCGLTDLIPFIGPYIGGAAAVIVGLTESPIIGIAVLVVCLVIQLVENYILQPIIMSKASSLHPVIIIIALLVFGHFFGIIGMILATPILTIIRVIYEFAKDKINDRKEII